LETSSKDPRPASDGENPKRNFIVQAARYSQLALTLPAATVVGWLLGTALDRWLGTSFLSVVGLLLGIAAGFVELVRTVARESN
jgi:F0F1-type ATP synthase assembly protein I